MTTETATTHDQCDHDFNAHLVLAGQDPMQGGIMRCPEEGCPCESTWGVRGRHPDPALVIQLRDAFEAGEIG